MTIDNSGLFAEAANVHIIKYSHQLNEGEQRFFGDGHHQSTSVAKQNSASAPHQQEQQQQSNTKSKVKRSTHSSTTSTSSHGECMCVISKRACVCFVLRIDYFYTNYIY
jgi:hypothetical protein